MIESQYTSNVHDRLPSHIHAWKINDNYQGGVQDAFYRNKDRNVKTNLLWIEYKFLKELPKRDTTIIIPDLSSLQKEHMAMVAGSTADEKALVVIGVESEKDKNGGVMGFELYENEWLSGIDVRTAKARLKNYNGICDLIVKYTVFHQ